MNAKLTRNGKDVALGFDNLYNVAFGEGDWTVVDEWSRPHDFTNKLCDFKLLHKDGLHMLIGTSANMEHWIGKEIDVNVEMSLNDMAEYLEA